MQAKLLEKVVPKFKKKVTCLKLMRNGVLPKFFIRRKLCLFVKTLLIL